MQNEKKIFFKPFLLIWVRTYRKGKRNLSASQFSFISFRLQHTQGFPSGASDKEPACQCRRYKRCGFNPGVGKIPWRRAWQPTPVFLPGESPWTEEPGTLRPIGSQGVAHDWSDLARIAHTNL